MERQYNKSVVAIIPARYNSKRFPGKPLAEIQGKTLLQRTYENAKRCDILDEIIIATDDTRIYDHAISFGATAVMTPEDCPTGTDRLAYVLEHIPQLKGSEIIVNIQGDEPGVAPETIKAVVQALQESPLAAMSTGIFPITSEEEAHNPNHVKCVVGLAGNVLYFSRALIPGNRSLSTKPGVPYYRHIGIYAYTPKFLLEYVKLPMTPLQKAEDLEQLKVLEHGYQIKAALASSISADVNIPEDIKKVEEELCKQNSFSSLAESARR